MGWLVVSTCYGWNTSPVNLSFVAKIANGWEPDGAKWFVGVNAIAIPLADCGWLRDTC
jgi:hypothetical protein